MAEPKAELKNGQFYAITVSCLVLIDMQGHGFPAATVFVSAVAPSRLSKWVDDGVPEPI